MEFVTLTGVWDSTWAREGGAGEKGGKESFSAFLFRVFFGAQRREEEKKSAGFLISFLFCPFSKLCVFSLSLWIDLGYLPVPTPGDEFLLFSNDLTILFRCIGTF